MASQPEKESKSAAPAKGKKDKAPELVVSANQNEEDQALQDNLALWVEQTHSTDMTAKEEAIYKIFHEVISATSSMTSIPKPMKFLHKHYDTLVAEYERTPGGKTKVHSGLISNSSPTCWPCCLALLPNPTSSKPTDT